MLNPDDSTSATPTLRGTSQERGRTVTPTTQQSQQELGKGRPGGSSNRPLLVQTDPPKSNLSQEVSSEDDSFCSLSPSISAHTKMSGDTTPRVNARPATSLGSNFGSPHHSQSAGGSAPRLPRSARPANLTSSSIIGAGSMSRSASRARPPLHTHNSTGAMLTGTMRGKPDEDDEVEVEDRGQALIRKRQKERKQLRKAKERERRMAEEDSSAPQTGQLDESFISQQRMPMTSRSVSRTRIPSQSRERQADEGYFDRSPGTATPAMSPRVERRPSSINSSTVDEDEDAASIIGEVVQEVIEEEAGDTDDDSEEGDVSGEGEEGVTLKDRQDAINIEHPFGLPIWKPALYRKSRSVTRNAESALHNIPSAAAERHLLPGNILWVVIFGWWLAIACTVVALLVSGAEVLGGGRGGYGKTLRGLAWYIGWPFGKYVEGEGAPPTHKPREASESSGETIREERREPTVSFAPTTKNRPDEQTPLLFRRPRNERAKILGRMVYWPGFLLIVAPLMLFVCVLCWGFVVTIPMAKLTWALFKLLIFRPLEINFRSAPKVQVAVESPSEDESADTAASSSSTASPGYTMRRARLTAGQVAPTSGPKSTVLLCTYRAVGLQYYKYTIGGVNIMFINLLPLVFFTIIDGMLILPAVERAHHSGQHISPLLKLITSQGLIFVLGLASVIPLSYFIGMAVASISAQSSIGMGAVINATFGSIIEIILYSVALTQGKGRLVEGSIVGSILAGVLLMPGASMCSGALKRKEQKFNAKSAGVTSTMLIMAIIGTLTPTMFYQTYGSFELRCEGCPDAAPQNAWQCNTCYYEHPDPVGDAFYQDKVKVLMYACAAILLFSYLIGLWFSLRTHAAQIWQNPQQLMKADEHPAATAGLHPSVRSALVQRATPQAVMQHILPVHKDRTVPNSPVGTLRPRPEESRVSGSAYDLPAGYTPFLESVDRDMKPNVAPMRLPSTLTTEDFTRAVAVATVSALRHQGSIIGSHQGSARKERPLVNKEEEEEGGGGHEAPSWSRGASAGVLLGCTLLYALIAEILVDVVDVVLDGSGLDEKFLGLTLFALVPNTTEFMNAMSFAMNGNIALSMEIGSAYALQVCLLQIPAMVAFSAFYDPGKMGEQVDTFTLIFPQWDVIAIILSIFLLTYTYIEARSNYHRGSILVLAYVVLVMGFYYAPARGQGDVDTVPAIVIDSTEAGAGWLTELTKIWV